jgi:hypothetical protein
MRSFKKIKRNKKLEKELKEQTKTKIKGASPSENDMI